MAVRPPMANTSTTYGVIKSTTAPGTRSPPQETNQDHVPTTPFISTQSATKCSCSEEALTKRSDSTMYGLSTGRRKSGVYWNLYRIKLYLGNALTILASSSILMFWSSEGRVSVASTLMTYGPSMLRPDSGKSWNLKLRVCPWDAGSIAQLFWMATFTSSEAAKDLTTLYSVICTELTSNLSSKVKFSRGSSGNTKYKVINSYNDGVIPLTFIKAKYTYPVVESVLALTVLKLT